jgi:ferredoxin-NADP reductase
MKFTLIDKKPETKTITTFIFKSDEDFSWTAGQLLHYTLPHEESDDRGIERYFTISSAPFEKNPSITTRFAGEKSSTFKKALFNMAIGDTIESDGLEGEFIVSDPSLDLVFIAGGIGITPFHSILKEFDHRGIHLNVTLLYANSSDEIAFKKELEDFSNKNEKLKIHYIISPERIDETNIRKYVEDINKPIFYISGPEPMIEALGKTLKSMGVEDSHIKHDFFPGYINI